jgi:hypothetical protein
LCLLPLSMLCSCKVEFQCCFVTVCCECHAACSANMKY